MDKATLEKQIDLAAARYAKNKDPAIRTEIDQLSQRLVEFRHLATLQNALERCRFVSVGKSHLIHDIEYALTIPLLTANAGDCLCICRINDDRNEC